MPEHFIKQASSYAADIDGVAMLITVLVGFWFILAQGVFFWLLFRFRARGDGKAMYITGEKDEEMRWISIPHGLILVCDVFIIVAAIRVWTDVKLQIPEVDETVRITVQQWAWTFHHAGPDGQLDTADDIRLVDELHVQVGKTYKYELSSRDVLHNFSVPVFRLKQDAIPGRIIDGWFKPTLAGTFDIQCAEICGIGHGIMPAKIYVETPEQHAAWLANPVPTLATRP